MKDMVRFEAYLESLSKKFLAFPWEDAKAYARWAAQTYYFVLNSTRLLALASACTTKDQQRLHHRFIQHAGEEKSHEKLLINDLKTLKTSPEQIPELPQTAGFYQAQYYWIQHVNPAAFMGYIYPLEGVAVTCGKKAYERVVKSHGKQAGTFLMVHAEEDIDHLKKAENEIRELGEHDFNDFMANLKVSVGLYAQILDGCIAEMGHKKVA